MKTRFYLSAVLLLYAALNLPFLEVFPPVDNKGDESWMANISVELLRTGRPVASMHAGTPVGESPQVVTQWLYSGALSGFFAALGPSVFAGRLLSFLCGLGVLVLTYFFGRALGGERVGLSASVLLASSIAFSWHSREIRPEMMLLLFSTLSVYVFHLARQRESRGLFYLSGLVSTLSVQVHPNGALFALSVLIVCAVLCGKRPLLRFGLFLILGLLTGFALWYFFNYLPYGASSFETVHKKYLPPVFGGDFFALALNAVNMYKIFMPESIDWLKGQYHSGMSAGFVYLSTAVLALALLVGRGRRPLLFVLSFIAIPVPVIYFFMGRWNWYHNSVFLALGFLALALSANLVSARLGRFGGALFTGLIAVFSAAGAADIAARNIEMRQYDFSEIKREVLLNVPAGAAVMGSNMHYFSFLERPGDRFMSYLFIEERCPDFGSEVKRLGAQYVIADDILFKLAARWCSKDYLEEQVFGFLKSGAAFEKVIELEYPNGIAAGKMLRRIYIVRVDGGPGGKRPPPR